MKFLLCQTRRVDRLCIVVPAKQTPRDCKSEVVYSPVQIRYLRSWVDILAAQFTVYALLKGSSIGRTAIGSVCASYLRAAGTGKCISTKISAW